MTDPVDREAPTPRLTSEWALHEEQAHILSERLAAHASVAARNDVPRSRRLRDLADACVSYGRAFRRWTTEDVPPGQKYRERAAFAFLMRCIDEELKP